MFKHLKIGKKLVISFIVVAIVASISSVVSVAVMKTLDTRYSAALVNYGFAQGDVGKLLSAFCRIDGNVHDAVSYMDLGNRAAAINNVGTQGAKLPAYFDEVSTTLQSESGKEYFNTARTAWDQYFAKAKELMALKTSNDATLTATIQKRMVGELDPLYSQIYNALNSLMDQKVTVGDQNSDELSAFSSLAFICTCVLIAVALLLSVLFGVFISRSISKPITACADRLKKLAAGDLKSPVPAITSRDETGMLATTTSEIVADLTSMISDMTRLLNEMSNGNFNIKSNARDSYVGDFKPLLDSIRNINTQLSDTLSQINQAADQVSSGSDQVSSGAQALSQGATEQASAVEELAATITEISQQVKNNAENANDASRIVNMTGTEIQQSNQKMQDLIKAMGAISHSSQEIGKVIKTIEDIAFQTNILALNAAVEAARAGAAGKGFAVVADEVRNLASKSAEAAKGTTALIEDSIKAVENGTRLADETAKSLLFVVDGAKNAVVTVDKISTASNDQATSITQVTMGIDQISSVVQTNSATAEQSAAASEELSGQAQMLKTLVEKFTLKENGNSAQHVSPADDVPVELTYTQDNKY